MAFKKKFGIDACLHVRSLAVTHSVVLLVLLMSLWTASNLITLDDCLVKLGKVESNDSKLRYKSGPFKNSNSCTINAGTYTTPDT